VASIRGREPSRSVGAGLGPLVTGGTDGLRGFGLDEFLQSVRTDSRIRSTASPVRNTSSRSDTADWGKTIGLVSPGECSAVHTEDLADGSHIYEAAPATLNPHHSAGRSRRRADPVQDLPGTFGMAMGALLPLRRST